MDNTAKYLIHAAIAADGVVERSDVVGAIFGQTEGLLGDDLDLRDLQQSSKVGRIDVQITSEMGQSTGELTIATSLDKVETAILAASLETITRVGPCHAQLEVTEIEDVRAAKRREVIDRAKELLATGFDETVMSSQELLEEVRQSVRVESIADYEGFPAGPRVVDSDAIIVVEGRADVLQLLRYGIKNAVAVEGTNVPDAIAELSTDRTVTAFLDGDRGGELILRELAQVGDVDYVAFAPSGRSVEALSRTEVLSSLREKVPYELLVDEPNIRAAVTGSPADNDEPTPSEGSTRPRAEPSKATESTAPRAESASDAERQSAGSTTADSASVVDGRRVGEPSNAPGRTDEDAVPVDRRTDAADDSTAVSVDEAAAGASGMATGVDAAADEPDGHQPETVRDHIRSVVEDGRGTVRFLDRSGETMSERPAAEAFEALDDRIETDGDAPYTVVLDGELSQRVLDVAAQLGVERIIAAETGSFVKQPAKPRVLLASSVLDADVEAAAH
ncbi:DNA primase DnaG [Haloferacaceae archaeon DSL9]